MGLKREAWTSQAEALAQHPHAQAQHGSHYDPNHGFMLGRLRFHSCSCVAMTRQGR